MWLRDQASQNVFVYKKAGTSDSLADAFAKGVGAAAIQHHLEGTSLALRSDRHRLAPALEGPGGAETKFDDEV